MVIYLLHLVGFYRDVRAHFYQFEGAMTVMFIKKSLRIVSTALLVTLFCIFSGASFSATSGELLIDIQLQTPFGL